MKKYIAVILALLVCLSACTVPQKKPGPVSETQTEPAPTAPLRT